MTDYTEFFGSEDSGAGHNSGSVVKQIETLAKQQESLEAEITELEELLAEKKRNLQSLSQRQIPDVMQELELEQVVTESGRKVQVGKKLQGSIPQNRAEEACDWLDQHGHGEIVKRRFIIEFGKGDEAWARKFKTDLERRKRKVPAKIERGVHHSTLKAFANERLKEGEELPLDLLGLSEVKFTKISRVEK